MLRSPTAFPQGVASFDPTPEAVLLWTRPVEAGTVRWTVARDPGLADVVADGVAEPDPDGDGTVVVDVGGLEPATSYWYAFELDGSSSPVGRARTLPGPGGAPVRLGLVSCARYSVAPLTVYRALAGQDVDLVVHLGDYIYEDAGDAGPREHDPRRPAVTLDDYRRRIAQMRTDPDCQALHQRHTMVAIWDDHDLADNAWSGGAKGHDPASDGTWRDRVAAAARARAEWLPVRDPVPGRTWRSIALGDVAELVLLDTRIAGRDRHAGDPGTPAIDDPRRALLGDEQRRWLAERMADRTRPWSVVASGVVVNSIELAVPPVAVAAGLLPTGYAVHDGRVLRDDQWDGYPAERARLAAWAADRAGDGGRTLLLSGDVHSSWAFEGPCGDDGVPVAVEITTPSVSSAPMGRSRLPGLWRALDRGVRRLPHVAWADVTNRGFTLVELSRDTVRATWLFIDPYDTDDEPALEVGAALRTEAAAWPPRWAADEPLRSTGVEGPPLPPRADDVAAIRRWHQRRRYAALTGLTLAGSALPGLASLAVLRRRRR